MQVDDILRWLERRGTRGNVAGMARYGIRTPRAFGVSMATMAPLVKRLGRDHDLALLLWKSGWHEARVLAAFVDQPERVTRRQMNAWASDFDNWAVCDSACFHLFDRSPLAWEKAPQWATSPREFVRRAGFALMASLALHHKRAPDAKFLDFLPLIEQAASDERNLVKKAVNWALRQIGKRSLALHEAAVALASRLASRGEPAARWVGKDALRELTRPQVGERLASRGPSGPVRSLVVGDRNPGPRA